MFKKVLLVATILTLSITFSEEIVIDEICTINLPEKYINNLIVVDDGFVTLSNDENKAYLRKFNKLGTEKWYRSFYPVVGSRYYAHKVVETIDGYAVIGSSKTTFVYLINKEGKEIAEKKLLIILQHNSEIIQN